MANVIVESLGPAPTPAQNNDQEYNDMFGSGMWSKGKFFIVGRPTKDPDDILVISVMSSDIPDNYKNLWVEIERTKSIINAIFPKSPLIKEYRGGLASLRKAFAVGDPPNADGRRAAYIGRLADLARASLGQDQVPLGTVALGAFQDDVVLRESGQIKNRYIRALGRSALIYSAIALLFYMVERKNPGVFADKNFLIVFIGCMLGMWLSFSIRNPTLNFHQLAAVEEDRLDPAIRPLFVGGMTLVVAAILATGMVSFTLGGFDSKFMLSAGLRPEFGLAALKALLIGVFCGLSEQLLPNALGQQARVFVGKIGGSGDGSLIGGAATVIKSPPKSSEEGDKKPSTAKDNAKATGAAAAPHPAGADSRAVEMESAPAAQIGARPWYFGDARRGGRPRRAAG